MMKIKISHLVKTTAMLTGLGFCFLTESAEAGKTVSRQSNVPDFRFSVFKRSDALPSSTEGRFNGAIKILKYYDDCSSLSSTTTPGFLCSPELAAEYVPFDIDYTNDPSLAPQANLLASLQGDVIEYTFEVDSPFTVNGRTYLPNDFYKFEVNVAANGLDATRAVNDLNYIIANNVLALFDFDSEMFSVLRDNGTTIRLDPPQFTVLSECAGGELLRTDEYPRDPNDEPQDDDPQGICVIPVDDIGETAIPEPNPLAGLLVLANVPILAGLGRFLKTKSKIGK